MSKDKVCIGLPLTQEIADLMLSKREQKIIKDFLQTARREISEAEERDEEQPYVPSEDLTLKYKKVKEECLGEKFCPIRQISTIFDFNIVFN